MPEYSCSLNTPCGHALICPWAFEPAVPFASSDLSCPRPLPPTPGKTDPTFKGWYIHYLLWEVFPPLWQTTLTCTPLWSENTLHTTSKTSVLQAGALSMPTQPINPQQLYWPLSIFCKNPSVLCFLTLFPTCTLSFMFQPTPAFASVSTLFILAFAFADFSFWVFPKNHNFLYCCTILGSFAQHPPGRPNSH